MTVQEKVVLVDEHDVQIGVMDKFEAHRNPARLHRAISVYLFNKKGELLIQQRSEQKIVGALQWGNTCCGNVWPGESYEACARRRLHFELGIVDVKLQDIHTFLYKTKCNSLYSEYENDHIFVGLYDTGINANRDEVLAHEFFKWDTLLHQEWNVEEVGSNIWGQYVLAKEWFPWFVTLMKDRVAVESITNELQKQLQ